MCDLQYLLRCRSQFAARFPNERQGFQAETGWRQCSTVNTQLIVTARKASARYLRGSSHENEPFAVVDGGSGGWWFGVGGRMRGRTQQAGGFPAGGGANAATGGAGHGAG